ncbi:Macrolide export ATP-binding/permease protein macB [Fibrisoma limi BUZ 3]|uniref:Macrolide export ATP-binding/permease protein macB n=1 Tax=Fibrisoma limi BUZ 3 TaxID=1185876 RepID=I2GEU4_9BACT|nr:ABC transporter permease [Fibrisoma limi]CCH52419.1 Macrolide export ATP-binding/permease protein macB [Fibrisoma limi BUZ 3]
MNPNQPPPPPKWPNRLLNRLIAPHLREEVLGDIHERYALRVQRLGERAARRTYWREVLAYVRPGFIRCKPNQYPNPSHTDMLRNYLKIAWRNLTKSKAFSAINIGGLAVGMAVAMLIGLWIHDELSFNKYHQNYGRIAQVRERGIREDGRRYSNTSLPYPLATELKTSYQRFFKHILIANDPDEHILTADQTKLTETGRFIEAGAPEMLTLTMLKGTWAGLQDPHSILLSASTAQALFGNADPMGKHVKINTDMDARVTGVYEDFPHNTEFNGIKFLAPFELWTSVNPWVKEQQWNNWFLSIYVQMQPNVDFAQVSAIIKDIELNKIRHIEDRQEQVARQPQIALLPMSRWHLYGNYYEDDKGPVQMVWLIGLIGAFVLLLACINFMNLSTARSMKRAKEVGIRKAVGSLRGQLVGQFLSESFLVVSVAFLVAILLIHLSLPWFNNIAAKQLTFRWTNPYFWMAGLGFILLTGFVAGSYPAFYLSSFQPVKVLKGTLNSRRLAVTPRKLLIVLQFTVSVTLITGTFVVYRQIQYAKNRPIGYDKAGLLLIEQKTADFKGKHALLRSELKNTGVVFEVAESRSSTTGITMWNGGFWRKGTEITCPNGCGTLPVSTEYGQTVGWQFVAGRDFNRAFSSDSAGFVINESFAKLLGLTNPVGAVVTWNPRWRKAKTYTILGVVNDMVALSPYESAIPTVFFLEDNYNWINIKLNPQVSAAEALPKIEAVFKRLIPTAPFDYKFADQEYGAKFAAEERIGKLASVFAFLAIVISCLGLFGLASFMAEQRTKEIGIRKVLGASVLNLWALLSKDFVFLVLIAFLLATPLAYYAMSDWLQKYEYRTELSWWIFAASGAGALLITLLTVSFQSIKAALMNPVKSLRTE